MRYVSINLIPMLESFAGFRPFSDSNLPKPEFLGRFSDAQLYSLTKYVYSLQPPMNPNPTNSESERGRKIFQREGCAVCHTPPLYTNNMPTPAEGFAVPEEHKRQYDILPVVVGTDPSLALKTRRGKGYYKVPSLKGVWYRGPFEHSGSVATLEDWFNPQRVRDDYVPTGYRGYGTRTRAITGHEFGLKLASGERQALIAFLKTL